RARVRALRSAMPARGTRLLYIHRVWRRAALIPESDRRARCRGGCDEISSNYPDAGADADDRRAAGRRRRECGADQGLEGRGPDRALGPAHAGAGRQRGRAGRPRDHGGRRLGGYHLPRQQPALGGPGQRALDLPPRLRLDAPPGGPRELAHAGHAGGRLGQARQAVAGGDEGPDAGGDPRRARNRVPRSDRRERLIALSELRRNRVSLGTLALLLLTGCATRNDIYVLLPGKGPSPGALTVTSGDETRTLDQPYAAARVSRPGSVSGEKTSAEEVRQTFGPALAAQPGRPVSFYLYFLADTDEFAPESK